MAQASEGAGDASTVDRTPPSQRICTTCQRPIPPGYPSCPACELEHARQALGQSDSSYRWLLIGLLALVAVVAGVSFLSDRAEDDPAGEAILANPRTAVVADDADAGVGDDEEEAPTQTAPDPRLASLQTVEKELLANGVKVWVDLEGDDVLVIRSDDCAEVSNQVSQLPDAARELASAIKCIGRLGVVGFEGKL